MGRVNRSKTGMNGTKPNRTNRSPSASMAGNRSAPGAASTLDEAEKLALIGSLVSIAILFLTVFRLAAELYFGRKRAQARSRFLASRASSGDSGVDHPADSFASQSLPSESNESQTPSQRYSHLVILEEIPPETAPGGWGMTMS